MYENTAAKGLGVLIERGLELDRPEDGARQIQGIKGVRKLPGIEVGGAHDFEWAGGTSSLAEIGCLEQTPAGVDDGSVQGWHVRRWHDPGDIRLVLEFAASP